MDRAKQNVVTASNIASDALKIPWPLFHELLTLPQSLLSLLMLPRWLLYCPPLQLKSDLKAAVRLLVPRLRMSLAAVSRGPLQCLCEQTRGSLPQ